MTSGTRRSGRPREQRVDDAVRAAVVDVLTERGYLGPTIDDVAERASVSKSAIYRRWKSKAELVFDAAIHPLRLTPPDDAGTLEADITGVLVDIATSLTRPGAPAAIPGLLADGRSNPETMARLLELVITAERAVIITVLDRAVGRGELPSRPEPELVHALLLGPVFALLYLLRTRTEDVAAALTAPVIQAVAALCRPEPGQYPQQSAPT